MAQGEYLNGFSFFKIEMVPEFDDIGNVDKFLRDVRQDGTESQGETLFHAMAKEQQQESFETDSSIQLRESADNRHYSLCWHDSSVVIKR